MAEVILGETYTDRITGYKGIAVYRIQWMEGCSRIGLQAKVNKDGVIPEVVSFDEPALIPKTTVKKKPGGPHGLDPKQRF